MLKISVTRAVFRANVVKNGLLNGDGDVILSFSRRPLKFLSSSASKRILVDLVFIDVHFEILTVEFDCLPFIVEVQVKVLAYSKFIKV